MKLSSLSSLPETTDKLDPPFKQNYQLEGEIEKKMTRLALEVIQCCEDS